MTGLMAFTFSAAAGICFFSGIAVLMGGKGNTGGILLSASLLFGGLALTVMTINEGETKDNE